MASASNSFKACCTSGPLARHDSEAAASPDVERSEVETHQPQDRSIDDHQLVVIPDEFVARAGDDRAGLEKALFQLPQILLTTAVRVRDQRTNNNATLDRGVERFRNVWTIEAENHEIDRLSLPAG